MRTLEIFAETSFRKDTKTRKGREREVSICQSILVHFVKEFNTAVTFSLPNPFPDFSPFPRVMEETRVRIVSHSTGSTGRGPHLQSWICTRTLYFLISPLTSPGMSHFPFPVQLLWRVVHKPNF